MVNDDVHVCTAARILATPCAMHVYACAVRTCHATTAAFVYLEEVALNTQQERTKHSSTPLVNQLAGLGTIHKVPCMQSLEFHAWPATPYVIHTIYVCVYIVEQNNGMICNLGITNYFTTSSATFFWGGGGLSAVIYERFHEILQDYMGFYKHRSESQCVAKGVAKMDFLSDLTHTIFYQWAESSSNRPTSINSQ